MQPYFMPYLGYWQLIKAVDKYVVYDDVQYIKGGWISRNNIDIPERLLNILGIMFESPFLNRRGQRTCYPNMFAFADVCVREMVIPNFVIAIEDYSFAYWPLESLNFESPAKVQSFGKYSFISTNLKDIIIPSSVQRLGDYCFNNTPIHEVTISRDSKLKSIGNGIFSEDDLYDVHVIVRESRVRNLFIENFKPSNMLPRISLRRVSAPNTEMPLNKHVFAPGTITVSDDGRHVYVWKTEQIIEHAFADDMNIRTVYIKSDSGLRFIRKYAFKRCRCIRQITLPDSVEEIRNYAFCDCGLESLIFAPNSKVQIIGKFAFMDHRLREVEIPNSVQFLGMMCFYSSHKNDYFSVVMHEDSQVQPVEWRVFPVWMLKDNVRIPQDIMDKLGIGFDIEFKKETVGRVILPNIILGGNSHVLKDGTIAALNIPADIVKILPGSFAGWPLKAVSFAADIKLKSLEPFVFSNTLIKVINIPQSVTVVHSLCFNRCAQLCVVTMEAGSQLTSIGISAFAYCPLRVIYISDLKNFDLLVRLYKEETNIPALYSYIKS